MMHKSIWMFRAKQKPNVDNSYAAIAAQIFIYRRMLTTVMSREEERKYGG